MFLRVLKGSKGVFEGFEGFQRCFLKVLKGSKGVFDGFEGFQRCF